MVPSERKWQGYALYCEDTNILALIRLLCRYMWGRLVVDVQAIYDKIHILTLLLSGILHLAQKSSWKHFKVSEAYIRDKSKANSVVKLLIFF
jgi:hypothetical protein